MKIGGNGFSGLVMVSLLLAGCGGGGDSSTPPPPPPTFSLNGSLSGLAQGAQLSYSNNGGASVTLTADGSFSIATGLSTGKSYSVSIVTQPANQTCTVSGGTGTIGSSNVTSVQISCTTNTYSLGGTVSGLTSAGLVLANGNDTVSITTNSTSFVFVTKLQSGAAYAVTVRGQPLQPAESCSVSAGSGSVAGADVSSVQVVCVPVHGQWIWRGGSSHIGGAGNYGTKGVEAASNQPGARSGAAVWTDASGNLWMFGGNGLDSTGALGDLGDLWKVSAATAQWTWVGGSSVANTAGLYGAKGVGAVSNVPGSREGAVFWVDSSGGLWMFGGSGHDSAGVLGELNDLWVFDPVGGNWTWVSGSITTSAPGVYGTRGVAAAANVPGARSGAVAWTDGVGDLWLFGGAGPFTGNFNTPGNYNDLWVYSRTAGQWTWAAGSSSADASGVYGTRGTGSPANTPGSRWGATGWYEQSTAKLWLFGGVARDSTGGLGDTDDVWAYGSGGWTWVTGSNLIDAPPAYMGFVPYLTPGARRQSTSWTDATGGFFLLGGMANPAGTQIPYTDFWKLSSLMAGAPRSWSSSGGPFIETTNTPGSYGTLGAAAPTSYPGSRFSGASWTDANGNLWLFGGSGLDSGSSVGLLNDLWEYVP